MNTSILFRAIAVIAVAGLGFGARPAEARFGKASAPASSSTGQSRSASTSQGPNTNSAPPAPQRSSGQPAHSASSAAPQRFGQYHDASAVNSAPRYDDDRRYEGERHYYRPYRREYVVVQPAPVYTTGYVYAAPAPGYVAAEPGYVASPEVAYDGSQRRDGVVDRFDLGGQVEGLGNGFMVGLQLRMDFQKFGFDARYDRMSLLAEDGSGTFDTLHLAQASLTYGLLTGERGRLRAHLGAYGAIAPDIAMVGPSVGLSTTVELIGPFTAEADGQLVLIPFTAVDTHAGLGLKLGPIEGRAGMRLTYLNDQGRVDGTPHADTAVGPYLGVAMVL